MHPPEKPTVFIAGYLPDEVMQEFMQYVRNFDVSHPGCHLKIMLSSDLSTAEMEKMLDSVDPEFKIRRLVPFKF